MSRNYEWGNWKESMKGALMIKLKTSKKHNVTVKWGFTLAEGGHSPLLCG